jgi:aminoglycoside 6'-N-acetyltransferase
VDTIAGKLVELRPVREADLDTLAAWFGDLRFVEWWGAKPLSRGEVAAKYLGRRAGITSLVVCERGRAVGYAQWWLADDGDEGGIDLVLVPEAQGRGLGSDAALALVRHLFHTENWRRVTVDPEARNTRAVGAWQKAGFRTVEQRGTTLLMQRERDDPDRPFGARSHR